ncbi:MAG: feruloyl-CoA synthase [Pigmentiphaga sp.]|nr:feruloyl-CoA synthase [Pigmentiphaga sp.]
MSDQTSVVPRYREVALGGSLKASFVDRADGALLIESVEPLQGYPDHLGLCLIRGATEHGERVLVARRGADGQWIEITWAQALAQARNIAQALLDRKLGPDRPILVLSGNDLEHFMLGLGAFLAGVPFAPISTAYSLLSDDFGKLRHITELLTPGLVFAASEAEYARAIRGVIPAGVEVVAHQIDGVSAGRELTPFQSLLDTPATAEVDAALARITPDTIGKFLFTSGSTKAPKAVVNTHRMMCSNLQMIRQCLPFLAETPPVLIDWLPWNHTFGGNHNIGIVLYNGGTLYIDDGRPTPDGIAETLRNLREIAPTIYFNVPKGFEEIAAAMEHDEALTRKLLSRVKIFFFAGAGLAPQVWERLDQVAERTIGERIRMITGLGMTETAPFALCANGGTVFSGVLGLPAPGLRVKLVPVDGKLEVRYRGPSVTPGYWRSPEQTAESFDEEGYFCSGDAARYIDPANRDIGLAFDGRIAEDFKLASGTFVSVGPLRARILADAEDYVQDVVIAGLNRNEIGILLFPRFDACREMAGLPGGVSPSAVIDTPVVREFFQGLVDRQWAAGTGGATRVARALIMDTPPSADLGEVTDKGSINQRAVLRLRADMVEILFDGDHPRRLLPRRNPN